ncbi:MAG TPA: prepilin-type N-terminal cleavage/methylation domain-containing protein [Geobacteraceae bacterium]|nr:prepilin-type N-terminal cleavage/methylation domain-containing protein [Geobacteraceae bacterium]
MCPTSILNSKAFTMLEVLVAIVIMTVGLLGMLQAINLAISSNLQNDMRNQAVLIAEDRMAQVKSMPFDNITASVPPVQKSVKAVAPMRNFFANYSVTLRVENVGYSKKIDVGVRWRCKSNSYEHVITSMVAKPPEPSP